MATHPQSRHIAMDAIIGADVRLRPSAETRREAAEDGAAPVGPTGEISDLVISLRKSRSASVDYAIVSVGGLLGIADHKVCLPCSALQHSINSDGEPTFTLMMTKEELEKMPEFDAEKAKKTGLRGAVMSLPKDRAEGETAGADRRADAGNAAEASAERGGRLALASDMKSCSVLANNEEFGSVQTWFVDPRSRALDFVAVSHGGVVGIGDSLFLVPVAACATVDHDKEPALQIAKSTKQIEDGAVKYEEPDKGQSLINSSDATRARAFFGTSGDREPGVERKR